MTICPDNSRVKRDRREFGKERHTVNGGCTNKIPCGVHDDVANGGTVRFKRFQTFTAECHDVRVTIMGSYSLAVRSV